MIATLEDATGGRVEIGAFRWDLLHLRVEALNVTIHGLEAPDEAPYAHVDSLSAQVSILNLFAIGTPAQVILREGDIQKPEFHLIVYKDGTTNQPHPRHPRKSGKPVIETLFDFEIGKLTIAHGTAHIANEVYPLDLQARDANIELDWVPGNPLVAATDTTAGSKAAIAGPDREDSYRSRYVADLAFAQGKFHPIPSRIDASVRIFHDSARLDSLQLVALDQTLTLKGTVMGFANPAWQAQANGQVDLRILAPYAGFVYTRSGVVNLNCSASGKGGQFEGSGEISSNTIRYQDPTVNARTGAFFARFHADPKQLLVSDIRTRIAQGGEIQGELHHDNRLDSTPEAVSGAGSS